MMKGLKTIILLGLITVLGISNVLAAGGVTLFVLLKDGNIEKYTLVEKPVISFEQANLLISTSTATISTPYSYSLVDKLYFDVTTSSSEDSEVDPIVTEVEELETEKEMFAFAYDGQVVRVDGAGEDPRVAVYGINGAAVQPRTQVSGQQVLVFVSSLPTGVYIIKVNNRSFKIVKK